MIQFLSLRPLNQLLAGTLAYRTLETKAPAVVPAVALAEVEVLAVAEDLEMVKDLAKADCLCYDCHYHNYRRHGYHCKDSLPRSGSAAIKALKPFASQALEEVSSASLAVLRLAGGDFGTLSSDISTVADLFFGLF